MRHGTHSRRIHLTPVEPEGYEHLRDLLDTAEIAHAFGRRVPFAQELLERARAVALIRRPHRLDPARSGEILGCALAWPEGEGEGVLVEVAYAIFRRSDRNAWTALFAAEAWLDYLFEELRVPVVGWRTAADNLPAQAILRRLDLGARREARVYGRRFVFGLVHRSTWFERRTTRNRGF